jgi:thymidine kinase
MPALLAIAEFVTKLHAICVRCGNLAQYSYRKSAEEQQVLLGEKDIYEPLCRNCFNEAHNRKKNSDLL